MSVKPIFLLSLPRAGSTLLQRLLGQHTNISTSPEPWIAIPLFYALKSEGLSSIYGHNALVNAMTCFIDTLPNQRQDYLFAAADFLKQIYSLGAAEETKYFLDKTPRYHLIIEDLMLAFPDAKFIFLWRNPLAIASSMIQTWGQGRWNLYMFWVDLYSGIDSLVTAYAKYRDRSIAVKYEDLTSTPGNELIKIMNYLDLDYNCEIIESFSQTEPMNTPGRGDPTGQYKYRGISNESMNSWKQTMSNPYRKAWSKNYLSWIGHNRLEVMGYNIQDFLTDIDSLKTNYNYLASDLIRCILGKLYCRYSIEDSRANKPWLNNIYYTKN